MSKTLGRQAAAEEANEVAASEPRLDERIARELSAAVPARVTRLSAREQEIVRLVARGLPNKSIGAVLDISPWTVATHLRRIYAKLNVPSCAAMVAAAAAEMGVKVTLLTTALASAACECQYGCVLSLALLLRWF
jgi:DNA-binding CsgD family transcriptional regulator